MGRYLAEQASPHRVSAEGERGHQRCPDVSGGEVPNRCARRSGRPMSSRIPSLAPAARAARPTHRAALALVRAERAGVRWWSSRWTCPLASTPTPARWTLASWPPISSAARLPRNLASSSFPGELRRRAGSRDIGLPDEMTIPPGPELINTFRCAEPPRARSTATKGHLARS